MRDRAARLLGALCRRFGDPFYNVQPRVSRTLLRALLDVSMPLTTHYGPHFRLPSFTFFRCTAACQHMLTT